MRFVINGKHIEVEAAPIECLDQQAVEDARRIAREAVVEARDRVAKRQLDREQDRRDLEGLTTLTDTPKIPLQRRVMPTIIATDIKGVSPMTGPCETLVGLLRKKREAEQTAPDPEKWDSMDARPGETPSPVRTPDWIEEIDPKRK